MALNLRVAREFSPDWTENRNYRDLFREDPMGYLHTVVVAFTTQGTITTARELVLLDPRGIISVPYRSARYGYQEDKTKEDLIVALRDGIPRVAKVLLADSSHVYVVTEDGNHRIAGARKFEIDEVEVLVTGTVAVMRKGEFFSSDFSRGFAGMGSRIRELKGA